MAPAPATHRNTNLDALRGLAIVMVLGRHADYSAYWTRIGWAGVDLFFVLSGFLVSGLLFANYQHNGRLDISRFWIRRGFKIWPAFYALIAAGLLVDAVMGHSLSTKGLVAELFFLQSYFQGLWSTTWSLAIEEHFYLSLPLVLLLIRRNRPDPFAAIPRVFCTLAVLALACRFAVGWKEDGTANYLAYLYPTHLRIDGLMFGVLLSYYKHFRPSTFEWIATWRGGWITLAVAILLISIFPVEGRQMHTWGLTALYLGAGVLVAKSIAFEAARLRAISTPLARIGAYSYSIYLWHLLVKRAVPHFHIQLPALEFWCYFSIAILFGIVAAKIIEFPALRLRDRIFPKSDSSHRPVPVAKCSEAGFCGSEDSAVDPMPASVTGNAKRE
jgi:peptidoglycan/LPS O-acetylase OafA/YrhL